MKKRTKSGKMSKAEAARVSSGILTDHPRLEAGTVHSYFYGGTYYRFEVKGPGDYRFIQSMPILGNEKKIAAMEGYHDRGAD